MAAIPISESEWTSLNKTHINLASSSLGASILSVSDEYFAAASNLLTPTLPIRKPGYFIETGAWYDGWETRRHNAAPYDWAIIKLGGPRSEAVAIEVDTAFFVGNHAPAVSMDGRPDGDSEWTEVMGRQECGPGARHFWRLVTPATGLGEVRLRMWPDGGIARCRVLGRVLPAWGAQDVRVDLADSRNGAVAVAWSDQHFGVAGNLLLPGRGVDMGDGWETKRSREQGHVDWVVIRLGAKGFVEEVVVDTMHFRGNFPQAVEIYAGDTQEGPWERIVGKSPCQKDTEHSFTATHGLEGVCAEKPYEFVKMVIIPDGGVKRLRVFGRRA